MAMKIGNQYSSERITPKDFERPAGDAGLGKPLVKRRVLNSRKLYLKHCRRLTVPTLPRRRSPEFSAGARKPQL